MKKMFTTKLAAIQILDIGSGTGKVGEELKNCGFQNIDGLDPAKNMVEISSTKGIYRNIFVGDLQDYCCMENMGKYDAIVSYGVVLPNHLPPEHLKLACQLLKSGGVLSFMTRGTIFDQEYGENVKKCLQELEQDGIIQKMVWEYFENYHGEYKGTRGAFVMYKKI